MASTWRRRGLRLIAGLGLWARMVRSRPVVAMALFAVTLVAAVLVTGGARLLDRVSAEDLVADLEAAEPRAANIQFVADGRFGVGPPDDPLRRLDERSQRIFDDELPPSIQELIDDQQFVVETPPFRVSSFPDQDDGPFTRTLRFRFQSNLDDRLTVVEGRAPAERESREVLSGSQCPPNMDAIDEFQAAREATQAAAEEAAEQAAETATAEADPTDDPEVESDQVDCRIVEVPVYEVAVTARTATDLMVELGDTVVLRPEPTHSSWAFIRSDVLSQVMLVEIVGIIELSDPEDGYWFGDDALHRPRVVENPDFRLVFASASAADTEYRALVQDWQDVHFDAAWRYGVDPDRIDQTKAADLAVEIDKLGTANDEVVTLLPEIINQHLVERKLTVALMSTAFAGVVAVSAAAAFVLSLLAAERQHHSMRLLLDRGVGATGLRWTGLWHGLVVVVPAVVLALAVAAWMVTAVPWSRPLTAAVLVMGAVVGAVLAAVWLAADRAARGTVSGPRSVPRLGAVDDAVTTAARVGGARRLVRDITLVTLAAGTVVLVRRRAEFGLGGSSSVGAGDRAGGGSLAAVAGSGADLDLLMAVTPPVIGLAAGVVAIRVMAPLFRALATGAQRLRGVVGFVGFRRLLQQGRAARSAVAIVVLAVGVAGFATVTRAAVGDAQRLNGWQLVGADVSVRGQTLDAPVPAEVADIMVAGGATVVAAYQQPTTKVSVPPGLPPAEFLAVEAANYARLLAGSPIDPLIVEPLLNSGSEDQALNGDAAAAVPAMISRNWRPAERPDIGEILEVRVGTARIAVEVVAVIDDFPATPVGRPAVIVDLETLRAAAPDNVAPTTTLFVDIAGNASRGEVVASSASDLDATLRIADRFTYEADLDADPFLRWSDIGLRLLAAFAVALAALSVVSALAIGGPVRRRDLGLLATMGLGSRQAAFVTIIEQLVPVVVASLAGIGVAVGLVRLMVPALNLTAFSGGSHPVEVELVGSSATTLAVVWPAVAIVAAVTAAVVVSTWRLVRTAGRGAGSATVTSLSMGEV